MSKKIPAWFPPIVVILLLVSLYGTTASTRLTWSNHGNDGGDFIAAILTGGIPHPTGYPTYMILGRLFQWIPFGDAYDRVVLLSFLPAAFAAGLFVLWVNSFRPGMRLPGLISGLVWGLSPLLWSQALIVEVYGLQSLFTVLALWWVTLLFRHDHDHSRLLALLALIFGVGLGNHITIIFFLPACMIGLIYWGRKTRRFKFVFFQIGAVVLGGLVYIYLPIQASGIPPINWGNPQTIGGFIWEVTGSAYQSLLGSVPINNVIDRLLASAVILRQQVGFAGLVLGVIGGIHLHQFDRKISLVCLWIFLTYLFFSIGYNTADSTAYQIPVIMVFSGWIGLSLHALNEIYWKRISIKTAVAWVVLLGLTISIPQTFHQIRPQAGYSAADYAEKVLDQFPEKAIIETSSEVDTFPLWAYHFGYGFRKDIYIIVLPLTQFDWYQQTLRHTYPALKYPDVINSTTSSHWGDQIESMNKDHIVCKGNVQNTSNLSITFTCSNGKVIQFVENPLTDIMGEHLIF